MSTLKVTNLQKLDGTTFPVGKISQVVQTSVTDTFTTSASSLTDITGLSVSIYCFEFLSFAPLEKEIL